MKYPSELLIRVRRDLSQVIYCRICEVLFLLLVVLHDRISPIFIANNDYFPQQQANEQKKTHTNMRLFFASELGSYPSKFWHDTIEWIE